MKRRFDQGEGAPAGPARHATRTTIKIMKSIQLIVAAALLSAGTALAQGNPGRPGQGRGMGGQGHGQQERCQQEDGKACDGEGRGKGHGKQHRRGPRDGNGPRRGGEGRPGAA